MNRKIAYSGIARLSLYYRLLASLEKTGEEIVSSENLGRKTGCTAAQVRRDLASFGSFGRPGSGYDVKGLKETISKILGKDRGWKVALVGVGNLGSALLSYDGFRPQGFHIVGAFDNDKELFGKRCGDIKIQDIRNLDRSVAYSQNIKIGIITVPAPSAQEVANKLVSCGLKAILNFAPAKLSVPKEVELQNVDLSQELDKLSYLLRSKGE